VGAEPSDGGGHREAGGDVGGGSTVRLAAPSRLVMTGGPDAGRPGRAAL